MAFGEARAVQVVRLSHEPKAHRREVQQAAVGKRVYGEPPVRILRDHPRAPHPSERVEQRGVDVQ